MSCSDADGLLLDALEELAGELEVDVGLEQDAAHLAQPFLDVGLGEDAASAEAGEDVASSFSESSSNIAGKANGTRHAVPTRVTADCD